MSISTAFVRVSCDGGNALYVCPQFDEIELTPLAKRGSYDKRNVHREIQRAGWRELPDGRHLCESCASEADAKQAEEDHA